MEDGETELEIGNLTIIVFSFGFELGVLLSDGLEFGLLSGLFSACGCCCSCCGWCSCLLLVSLAWTSHFAVCLTGRIFGRYFGVGDFLSLLVLTVGENFSAEELVVS